MSFFKDITSPTPSLVGRQTFLVLRNLGYCLIFLFLLDFAALLVPPKFTDSSWELSLFGQVIERIPLLLLSFPLALFGEYNLRKEWEKLILKIVSWLALVIAILLIFGIPLTIVNTARVQGLQEAELLANVTKQNVPIQEISNRLNKAESDSDILEVLRVLNPQQKSSIDKITDPKAVKKKLLNELTESVTKMDSDLATQKRRVSLYLWKNSVKWIVAALVSAIFLIYIWNQSKWSRIEASQAP
jgi:hypothetical protein